MQAHATELIKIGARVSVHGVADDWAEGDRASWAPASVRIHGPVVRSFSYAPTLSKALNDTALDIVHQHGLWLYPSVAVSSWRRKSGKPVMISTQGMLEPWALKNSAWKKRLALLLFERSNLAQASCIHCSDAEVEGVRAVGLRNPIAIIPNGADLPDLTISPPRPGWLPNDGRRTLLFLGRLHPKKGIREMLDAWAILRRLNSRIAADWRLVFVGWDDGGHSNSYVTHARSIGLDDIIFPGPIFGEEKKAAYMYADAFVLPSYSEGFPMTILEAWAHSLPVFMTRACNIPEGFDVGAAIEIDTDPDRLARILFHSLSVADLAEMGRNGRTLVEARFAWPLIAAELYAVYRWLTLGVDRPCCVQIC